MTTCSILPPYIHINRAHPLAKHIVQLIVWLLYLHQIFMGSHYLGSRDGSVGSMLEEVGVGRYTIKPKTMDIVWGKDKRYWLVNQGDGSAELIQVCWLEVTGSFPAGVLTPGKYVLRFNVKMRADAFGWRGCPVRIMVKAGEARPVVKEANLDSVAGSNESSASIPNDGVVFEIKEGATGNVIFGMFEIWRERWKGGMIINRVTIQKLT